MTPMKTKVKGIKTKNLLDNMASLRSEVEELNTVGIMSNPERLHLIRQLNETEHEYNLVAKKLDNIKSTLQPLRKLRKEKEEAGVV